MVIGYRHNGTSVLDAAMDRLSQRVERFEDRVERNEVAHHELKRKVEDLERQIDLLMRLEAQREVREGGVYETAQEVQEP